MSAEHAEASGPDLTQGIPITEIPPDTPIAGHVGGDAVLLVRHGDQFFAVGAHCTHYHAPLADGLVAGETLRCPWHHAAFDLRTGEALTAPAFSPLPCWTTEIRDGKVFVSRHKPELRPAPAVTAKPQRIVIVGGGAAGFAAAEMLRRSGHAGSIVMLSEEDMPPVDRPNLSKDYLAGSAPEDWLELRPPTWYVEAGIDLRLKTKVAAIDTAAREVVLADGARLPWDKLLMATGSEPVRLAIPGMDRPHVFTLRSAADSRAIIARAAGARCAVVLGASFIGLEVAAALSARGLEVHVVAPEAVPMARVLGPELGGFVRRLHEAHGVRFHLGDTASAIGDTRVTLASGATIDADLVVAGVGVRPRLTLAEGAGLALDRGVLVDPYLETSVPGIYAAGDIARWPDVRSGQAIRVEHWVVAQRQGQTAARNMLGGHERFEAVPFFWSQHYDVVISYVGHAETWDELKIEGDIETRDCLLRYRRHGRTLAVASIFRDLDSLKAELELERT